MPAGRTKYLKSAIGFFLIAAITGTMFRAGMAEGGFLGLELQNIRHAHSHLMFFGWAAFIPFAVLYNRVSKAGLISKSPLRRVRLVIQVLLGLIPLTYFLFLFYGYHPVQIGTVNLPLAVITSSLIMVCWYVLTLQFYRLKDIGHSEVLRIALITLSVSSLGAWGVGVVQFTGLQNVLLGKALTHFFLSGFTEGWIVLISIWLIAISVGARDNKLNSKLLWMIFFGSALTFSYGISASLLPDHLQWTARIAGVFSSIALLLILFQLCENVSGIWKFPFWLLAVKGIMQFGASVMPYDFIFSDHSLRMLYLHVLLLGGFTSASITHIGEAFDIPKKYIYAVFAGISMLLFTLLVASSLWPQVLKGVWIYSALLYGTIPVIVAVSAMFIFANSKSKLTID